jgi:hypothetical protein
LRPLTDASLLMATISRSPKRRACSSTVMCPMCSRSKQPLVNATRSPLAFHSATRLHQFLARHHLVLGVQGNLRSKRGQQLVLLHRHRAHLAHHNAGSNIGHSRRSPA